MISWSLTKLTKQSTNTFCKQLNKTRGKDLPPKVHQLNVEEIKLAETHSIKQAKLSWSNHSKHNILHWQIHWCFSSPFKKKTKKLHINDQLQVFPECTFMAYGYTSIHTQTWKINELIKAIDEVPPQDLRCCVPRKLFYSETTSTHLTTNYTTKSYKLPWTPSLPLE